MASYTAYDAKDVVVTVDDMIITGLAEDMVTGEKDEELASFSVGAQGDVVASAINNTLGTVSITVQRTCPQRHTLFLMAKTFKKCSVWVSNTRLGERFGGTQAYLKSLPEMAESAEAGDLTFEFQVLDYTVQQTAGADRALDSLR